AADLDWPVEIAGEANHPEGGQARLRTARALGVLTPPEMAERLGATAIYAAPARYEPFGLSILEAASSGCALVLGDIPSLREIWGDDALFVHPGDHRSLISALELLIENKSLRLNLAWRARRRALRFSPRTMAREHIAA